MSATISADTSSKPAGSGITDPGARLPAHRLFTANGIQMGPFVSMTDERQTLAAKTWRNFTARQLGATIGAELGDIDITVDLAPDVIEEIREALHTYKVIFFRDQPLTADRHVKFASSFGELELHPFLPGSNARPELVRFEKSADAVGYENSWHHDVTWRALPSMGAVLHAVKVPNIGGDTLFSDMCAAYDGLSDEIKERIDGLTAEHDFMQSFGRGIAPDKMEEMRAKYPIVEHPVVCTHSFTGRKYLYVNRVFVTRIVGMEAEESRALLEHLFYQANYPEYQWNRHWYSG